MFREPLGTSSLAFVTTTRLERAHRLLRQGAPEATVTQAALDCGFSHLDRISALFHGKYGVQPSAVLDEARRRGPASRGPAR